MINKIKTFHPTRGQIYICDLGENNGSIQNGNRPVLVLQDDDLTISSSTVIVAPITSVIKKTGFLSHITLPNTAGLDKSSMVMIEQLRTVNISDLKGYVGSVKGTDTWRLINNGIKKTLGLWHKKKEVKRRIVLNKEVTCLCYRCISFYKDSPAYKVRRLTPPNGIKDTCDRCGYNLGFDYQIIELGE